MDGKRVSVSPRYVYLVLNKPMGVVTTARDPQGRRTVVDLVRRSGRLYPVGRLDADTTGLVLLTNHGDLAHRLMHPRYEVPRVYLAEVEGRVTSATVARLLRGVPLEDGVARARAVSQRGRASARTSLEITMTEGRKREVRRMLAAVGHPVRSLARVSFGPVGLGPLQVGRWRDLTASEVGRLLDAVRL